MARYSLKSFLRETRNSLLQAFFKREGVLSDFKWTGKAEDGKEIPLPETDVKDLAEAIEQIEDKERAKLICEMKDIASLADENIISTMIEHGKKARYNIKLVEEFSDKKVKSPFDRVMWVNLYHNELYRYTLKFIQVISIDGTMDFLIKRKKGYKTDTKKLSAFKESVIKHYVGRGRGEKCIIDDYYSKADSTHKCN